MPDSSKSTNDQPFDSADATPASETNEENKARYLPSLVERIGYKNPPKHSRWKPGQSGNPSGHRKKSMDLLLLVEKILTEQITLREGNKTSRVPAFGAAIIALRNKALKGDTRAILELIKIAKELEAFDLTKIKTTYNEFTDDFLNRLKIETAEDLLRVERELDAERAKKANSP